MSCINQLLSRRSVRKFKKEPVADEIIQNILEAGRLAPSATNVQPWHFIMLRKQEAKEACSFQGFNGWTSDSDFIIVGVYKPSQPMMDHYALMDVTIALQNMVIAGALQGVGSCWIGAWDDTKLRSVIGLPSDYKIVGLVPFGIPDGVPSQPNKKPLENIVHYEKW
ncbi:MAG: nitroreductase family protein [Candidatus Brocadiales bacterium]|nr:nitroreductase family protein [Candidatus Brocadiales bacterium]